MAAEKLVIANAAIAIILATTNVLAGPTTCAPWQRYAEGKAFRCDGPKLYMNDGTGDYGWQNCGGQKVICGVPNPCLDPKKLGMWAWQPKHCRAQTCAGEAGVGEVLVAMGLDLEMVLFKLNIVFELVSQKPDIDELITLLIYRKSETKSLCLDSTASAFLLRVLPLRHWHHCLLLLVLQVLPRSFRAQHRAGRRTPGWSRINLQTMHQRWAFMDLP